MTNHTAQPVQDGTLARAEDCRHIVRKAAEIALIVAVAAVLAAAWLALMLLPLDFSTLRPN